MRATKKGSHKNCYKLNKTVARLSPILKWWLQVGRNIRLSIPMKPVPMERPRFSRFGRPYTATTSRKAKLLIQREMFLCTRGMGPLSGALKLSLEFYFQASKTAKGILKSFPAKRPDLDNLEKLVMDSGNQFLWKDDAQIVELHSKKLYGDQEMILIFAEELP